MAAPVEVLVKAKNETDAAFNAVVKNLDKTAQAAKNTEKQMVSSTAKAGAFADAIGKTTNTLARSADAFGLSANAMRTIGDVADVAQIGFQNLSSSAAGFNAASLGVAGAGLAIGTALGNLLMQIPAVRREMDELAAGAVRLFGGGIVQSTNEVAAANANWAMEQKKVSAAYDELLLKQTAGLTLEETRLKLGLVVAKHGKELALEQAKLRDEAAKKAEAEAQKEAARAEQIRAAWQAASEQARAAWDKFYDNLTSRSGQMWAENQKNIDAWAKNHEDKVMAALKLQSDLAQAAAESSAEVAQMEAELAQQIKEDMEDAIFGVADAFVSLGNTFGGVVGGILGGIGNIVGAFQSVKNQIEQIKSAGGGLTGVLGKVAGFAGIAGTIFSVGKGIFDSLFGGAKKAREEMNKLRNEFVQSQGGMVALKQKADAAGISLQAMLNPKNAGALQAAIAGIKSQLDLWEEGQDAINAAMEKYDISVTEMGPKFAQQELDKQAAEVAKAFGVLAAAGGDISMIASKMGDDVLALVGQYKAAGLDIPEALRPVLEAMLKNGQLVDENGEAYGSLEEAGITFAKSMTDAMAGLMVKIEQMIQVLAKGFNVPINFNYSHNGDSSAHGPGNKPGENMPEFETGGVGNFGAGTPAMLHNMEAVLPLSNPQAMKMVGGALAAALAPMFAQTMMSNNNRGATRGDVNLDGLKVGTWFSGAARRGVVKGPPMGRRRRSQ